MEARRVARNATFPRSVQTFRPLRESSRGEPVLETGDDARETTVRDGTRHRQVYNISERDSIQGLSISGQDGRP